MADSAGHDQATVLEVPVTIQGAKHVEGSEQRQIFTETTKTTIVFGNGAVVNLNSKVVQGQCVFLRNEHSGREILCKVLEWRQVAESGYVDLEFTTRDPKFWDTPAPEAAIAPAAAPAAAVAVATSKRAEALDMLPASAPAPTVAPITEASAPAGKEITATSDEGMAAKAIDPPVHHTAEELDEAEDALAEAENETERNDTKDAELLAKLIASDPKRKPKREAAAAEARETEGDATAEDAPDHGETHADAAGQGKGDGWGERKAALVATLTPWVRKLHRFTYGKGAVQLGIAASVLLVFALGFAWHAHRSAIRRKNQASAATAQAKQNAQAATAQSTAAATGKSGGETEAPAHGNNSGATPAQAAQKIQQQTGAPEASVATAGNAAASGVPSATPSTARSASPKLEARESAAGTDHETPDQTRHRRGKGPSGGETIPARIVSQSPAAIPPWAKGLDTDGVVQLDALIDEKGNLRATKPLSGPRLLQHAAERAVALWIFEPALTDGKPTATHMVLTVQFQR